MDIYIWAQTFYYRNIAPDDLKKHHTKIPLASDILIVYEYIKMLPYWQFRQRLVCLGPLVLNRQQDIIRSNGEYPYDVILGHTGSKNTNLTTGHNAITW